MSSVLLILVIVGPLILFGLVRSGVHLIVPMLVCVIAAGVGIALFVAGMNTTTVADQHNGDLAETAVYGMLIVVSAAFGGMLLGVVVLARWFGGEYANVNEGQER